MDFEYLILLATLMVVPILGCSQNNHRHTELHDTDSATEPLHGTETETTITLPTDTEPPEPPRGYVSHEGELKTGDIWGRAFGGDGWCNIQAVAIGPDESVYATGWFTGTADFDPGDGEDLHTSPVGEGMFLTRFSKQGERLGTLVWTAEDTNQYRGYGNEGFALAVSEEGEIYLGGQFNGTVDLDPGLGEDIRFGDGFVPFLLKLGPDFSFLWVETIPTRSGRVSGILLQQNKVLVTGQAQSDAVFDIGPDEHAALEWGDYIEELYNHFDCYAISMTAEGRTEWVRVWGGLYTDMVCMPSLLSDGFVVLDHNADYMQDLDPGPEEDLAYPEYEEGPLILGFGLDGNRIFVDHWRQTSSFVIMRALSTYEDTLFVTGYFIDAVDFGTATVPDIRTPISDKTDSFLMRIERDNTHPWITTWSGTGESNAKAYNLKATADSIMVIGRYIGEVNFGTAQSPMVRETANWDEHAFILDVDYDGSPQNVHVLKGESSYAIALDIRDNTAVVGGAFYGDLDLDMGAGADVWDSPGLYACYLVRFPLE